MSNPQEPYQPGRPGAGQHEPVPGWPGVHGDSGQAYSDPGQLRPRRGYPVKFPPAGPDPLRGSVPGAGPFGLPGQEPPSRSRRKLWTILGIAGGVLLLALIGVLILVNLVNAGTNQAKGLADGFTKLVIAGETSEAYDDYLDPALKEQLSKETFIAGVKTLEMDGSCQPAYNSVKAASGNNTKSADVAGLITCNGDRKIDLVYRFEGAGELKMVNIKLKPQA